MKTTTLAQIVALIAPPVALVMEAGNVQRMASRANVTKRTMVTIAAPIVVLKDPSNMTPRVTPLRWLHVVTRKRNKIYTKMLEELVYRTGRANVIAATGALVMICSATAKVARAITMISAKMENAKTESAQPSPIPHVSHRSAKLPRVLAILGG